MKATSKTWYASLSVKGKLRRFPLTEERGGKLTRIEIKGRRPSSLKRPEEGDSAFLASYYRARAAHDRLENELQSKGDLEDLAQRVFEAKTGSRINFVKVAAVPEAWAALPRKRDLSQQYEKTAINQLKRFAAFIEENFPEAEDLAGIRVEHIRAFLDAEWRRGIAGRTWNSSLKLLKTVFAKLEPNADAYRSFLKGAVVKDENTAHSRPFTEEEIAAIMEAAQMDDVLRGPIVTGICTAMRRGGCCRLKWSAVDLEAGFIEIKTNKTGETAEIPLLPALRKELEAARSTRTGSPFVWPEAAALYENGRQKIDKGLRIILAQAGFANSDETSTAKEKAPHRELPILPPTELRQQGLNAIEGAQVNNRKKDRMRSAFLAYLDGKTLPEIALEMRVSKSTISLDLNEIERLAGAAVLRRPTAPPLPPPISNRSHPDPSDSNGQRRNRITMRAWQAFRVTFVTRALAVGMAEELVRRVTGHTAVDVVRRHYFRPGREDFRREFEKTAPKSLMNGTKSKEEQLRQIIEGMTAKTLQKDKARALALLDGRE